MVNTKDFYNYLINNNLDFFAGVPDSLLKNLCAYIKDNAPKTNNIIAANEGSAVAMCAGYHLSTNKYGVVYMQNSGIGNAVNPLLSLADEKVYSIPMLLIIGWRGEPGKKDEPQHVKQGLVTLQLLEAMEIDYKILSDNFEDDLKYAINYMKENSKPFALVVKKGTFSEYNTTIDINDYELTREQSLETILDKLGNDDFIVSTTGKTSREIFEIRERKHENHCNDFLTVGSMGHTASIAYGVSIGTDKNVYCIDGDGSFIMHMGNFGILAQNAPKNFKYIVNNNGSHESVGGQPTVGYQIDMKKLLEGYGFKHIYEAKNNEEINNALDKMKNEELSALILYTKAGARDDLGRPTNTPVENKQLFMKKIGAIK